MPDTIPMPEMDKLYDRIEKKVNVERQTEIFDFLRTHKTFDGRNPDGSPRFKLRTIPETPNWNWRGQERLATEIREETERRKSIKLARTEKTLKKLSRDAVTSETRKLAEDKLSKIIEGGEVIRRRIFRGIQSSESREEAISLAEEAEESELLTEKTKITLRKMAEQKVFEEE